MARGQVNRPIIKMRSTAGTGYTYVTRKNRRNNPDRLTLHKYDPIARRHVEFREERWESGWRPSDGEYRPPKLKSFIRAVKQYAGKILRRIKKWLPF